MAIIGLLLQGVLLENEHTASGICSVLEGKTSVDAVCGGMDAAFQVGKHEFKRSRKCRMKNETSPSQGNKTPSSLPLIWCCVALACVAGATLNLRAGTFDDPPSGQTVSPPQGYNEVTFSLGVFKLIVDDYNKPWSQHLVGYPGRYSEPNSIYSQYKTTLTSPLLNDASILPWRGTEIGRSLAHIHGDPAIASGAWVGRDSTITLIKPSDFSSVPFAFDNPVGTTREVYTELQAMNLMSISNICPSQKVIDDHGVPFIPIQTSLVRAGQYLQDGNGNSYNLPICRGQVQSVATTGVPTDDFPARNFFEMFVEISLPAIFPWPDAELYNLTPLIVENYGLTEFPPHAIYKHAETAAVPVYFKADDVSVNHLWKKGDRFGWVILAGHGVKIDCTQKMKSFTATDFLDQTLGPTGKAPGLPVAIDNFYGKPLCPPARTAYATPMNPAANTNTFSNGIQVRKLRHGQLPNPIPLPVSPSPAVYSASGTSAEFDVFVPGLTPDWTHMQALANVTIRMTNASGAGSMRVLHTEMTQLDVHGGSLPPGTLVRESPSKPSLGQTTIRPVDGGYRISSFFDVWLEVSTNSGTTWAEADSPATVVLTAPTSYDVVAMPDYSLIANNLNNSNNNINIVIPDAPEGATLNKWNNITHNFEEMETYWAGSGWDPGVTILNPGEAAMFWNPEIVPVTMTFTGDPIEPRLPAPLMPSQMYGYGMQTVSEGTHESITGRSIGEGVQWSKWNPTNQAYQTFVFTGGAWKTSGTPVPAPTTGIGEGVFITGPTNQNCIRIYCPADITVWSCTDYPVSVPFTATVSNYCGPSNVTVVCTPPSPGPFTYGTTTVNCTAWSGNYSDSCSFHVTVQVDTQPPQIHCPSNNLTVCLCSNECVVVHYGVTATDDVDPAPVITCNPADGSCLPVGNHLVNCVAVDACGKSNTCTFSVTVAPDTMPPVIIRCPENVTTVGCTNAFVKYTPMLVTDDCTPNVSIVCVPPNGSSFPLGSTQVTCTAYDNCGKSNSCVFLVTVLPDTVPPIITHCPTNIVVCMDATGCGLMPDATAQIQATDMSGPVTVTQNIPAGQLLCTNMLVTFTVTDACGNTSQCTAPAVLQPCCVKHPPGMVLWLTFDETAGVTCLNSMGGNNGVRYDGNSVATSANGPTRTFGQYVNNSLRFDGSNDKVVVPNYSAINFGTGDFSMDAWVKWDGSGGVRLLMDKRTQSGGSYYGYDFYLYDGRPGLQLADGGYVNIYTAAVLPVNVWTHLAVTVQRKNANGLKFYTNGVPAGTYDPTSHQGNLNNTQPLWIGVSPLGGSPFKGYLDEVELFRRALTADEVRGLYLAKWKGKCRPYCSLPWVTAVCGSSATVTATICNPGPVPLDFIVGFKTLSAAEAALPNAVNWPGLSSSYFSQSLLTVQVPANQCAPVSVIITRPTTLYGPQKVAAYQMLFSPLYSGELFTCVGTLRDGWINCPPWSITNVVVRGDAVQIVPFTLTNPSNAPLTLNLQFIALDSQGQAETSVISLNGLPPGTSANNQILLPPLGTTNVSVAVSFLESEPWTPFYVVVQADIGEGGAMVPVASVMIRNINPPTVGPVMGIGTTNGLGVVSWDAVNTDFLLESILRLDTTNWLPVAAPVIDLPDGGKGVMLPATNGNQFFRFRQ